MLTWASSLIPALANVKLLRSWAGPAAVAARRLPDHRHPDGVEALLLAVLHRGVTLAPVIGSILTDLITDGKTAHDISPYRLSRFAPSALGAEARETFYGRMSTKSDLRTRRRRPRDVRFRCRRRQGIAGLRGRKRARRVLGERRSYVAHDRAHARAARLFLWHRGLFRLPRDDRRYCQRPRLPRAGASGHDHQPPAGRGDTRMRADVAVVGAGPAGMAAALAAAETGASVIVLDEYAKAGRTILQARW